MAEKQSNKDRIKEITAGIEQGIKELFESDRYRQYLSTMSRFHKYSLNNVMLIHSQRPDATLVAGFNKWKNQFGRHVKKGERGIQILAPVPFKKKVDEVKLDPHTKAPMLDKDGNLVKEEKEVSVPMFKVVSVFDVSQTDGKPLPVLAHSLSGDVQQYEVFMEALQRTSPVPIVIAHTDRDVDGFFDLTAQQITIQDGMSQVQTICAGVHEIAHSKLHNYDKMTELADDGVTVLAPEEKDRHTEEVEAESISYAVCQYFGIETADNSFGYIATWSQGKELKELRASLETINHTSSELISSIEQHFKEICKERGIAINAPAEVVPVAETTPAVSGGEPIVNTDDILATFAGDFTVHLMIKTNGEPIPGIPAEGIDGICAWVEEKLRAGDLRPLSDILLDMMAIYGQDERFNDLTDRLVEINKRVYIPQEPVEDTGTAKRYEYRLVSNFHRTAPEDTTYIQQYTFNKDAVLFPGPVLFVGTYEKCLELQEKLKAGTITPDAVREMQEAEKLYLVSDSKYLYIQRTDSGFDYTIYDKDSMKLLDGGRLDDPMMHISTACINICEEHGMDFYKVSIAPTELIETLAAANMPQELREQSIDVPQPDPYVSQAELQSFGYTAPDMLPISTDFALELMERDVTVYMLHSDNTEAMAFDSEDLAMHIGMLGITTEDWNAIKEWPDIVAISTRFAVSYQRDLQTGMVKPPILPENHLRAAEMSLEDDYGMIDGIINNGKAPGTKEQPKEKKPSVIDQLKSQSTPPRQKNTHKQSKGREI